MLGPGRMAIDLLHNDHRRTVCRESVSLSRSSVISVSETSLQAPRDIPWHSRESAMPELLPTTRHPRQNVVLFPFAFSNGSFLSFEPLVGSLSIFRPKYRGHMHHRRRCSSLLRLLFSMARSEWEEKEAGESIHGWMLRHDALWPLQRS